MKATQISESIEWASPDHEWYMSLQGLINQNNGLFKSPKQASFILNRWAGKVVDGPEAERYANNFGTPVATGNRVIQTTGYYRWADYGSRSVIPFLYVFEVDDFGVVRKWKVGYRGNMRDGAAPDPKKANLEFTRDAGLDTSHLIVQKSDAEKKAEFVKGIGGSVGHYVGTPGQKHDFGEVTLIFSKTSWGDYGARTFQIFKDSDGNLIWYTGKDLGLDRGEKAILKGKVKQHMVSKRQEKVTIILYPKVEKASIEENTDLGPYDFFTEKQTEFLEGYLSNLINDAVEITEITATGRTGRGMPVYRVFITYDGKDGKGYRGSAMITGRPEGERTVVDIDIYDLRGYGRQHPSVDFQNYDD